ncbi:730_t:CDS:2, partial [Gigaspora rosea]
TIEKLYRKQKEVKAYYDRKIRVSFGFEIGDKVLLEDAKKRYYNREGVEDKDKETPAS